MQRITSRSSRARLVITRTTTHFENFDRLRNFTRAVETVLSKGREGKIARDAGSAPNFQDGRVTYGEISIFFMSSVNCRLESIIVRGHPESLILAN